MLARALLAAALLLAPLSAWAQGIQYERPVQVAPQQETIGGGYQTPPQLAHHAA